MRRVTWKISNIRIEWQNAFKSKLSYFIDMWYDEVWSKNRVAEFL